MKIMKLCAFLLLSIVFAGCKSTQPTLMDNSVVDTANYLLGAGDTVNINVAGQPDLTMKVVLDNSGAINYPYIGKLELKGKTASQVDAEITQRLQKGFVLNPMVTVNIAEFRKFYISGEIENPNGYAYEPGLTVEKAIALGGGYTDRADRSDLRIRQSSTGELLENVDVTHSVLPGDLVIIGIGFF